MKKSAKGKGYTVRIKGRKCLAASILEKQVEAAQKQFEELQVQNELLRTKEAMQLEALAGWEALLQQLAAMQDPTATDEERATKLVSAAMLDMQALKLQQELRPAPPDAGGSAMSTTATTAAVSSHNSDHAHPSIAIGKASDAANSPQCSNSSSTGGRAGSSSAAASSSASSRSGCHIGSLPAGSTRLPHLMAMLDAKEIPALKQLTLAEMAGRVRCAVAKVRAAQQQAEDPMSDAAVVAAMQEYATVMIGHSVANNEQHTHLGTLNLETLQPETPSEEHIKRVVAAMQLQPQQEQRTCMAFHTNSQSEAQLMRQQQKLKQQLQDLLAPQAQHNDTGSPSLQPGPQQRGGSVHGTVASSSSAAAAAGAVTNPAAAAAGGSSEGHSVRDKAGALLAIVSGNQQGLSTGDLAWLTKAAVDVGGNPQQTKEMAAAGCLSVHAASNAEALLAQLSKLVFAQQQQSRSLTMMWMNLLTPEQQAAAVIAAYPHFVHQARVCAKVAEMNAADSQR